MGLPLLIAIIGYSIIIFLLTMWLTKYHDYHCRISHPKGRIVKETYFETQLGNQGKSPNCNPVHTAKPANESRTTPPSGNESFFEDDEGGV